jgi:hypothetical protein
VHVARKRGDRRRRRRSFALPSATCSARAAGSSVGSPSRGAQAAGAERQRTERSRQRPGGDRWSPVHPGALVAPRRAPHAVARVRSLPHAPPAGRSAQAAPPPPALRRRVLATPATCRLRRDITANVWPRVDTVSPATASRGAEASGSCHTARSSLHTSNACWTVRSPWSILVSWCSRLAMTGDRESRYFSNRAQAQARRVRRSRQITEVSAGVRSTGHAE